MHARAAMLIALGTLACGGVPAEEAPLTTDRSGGGEEPERPAERAPARPLDEAEAATTYAQAMQVHVQAQELRARCDEGGDASCDQAQQLFGIAADTWRALVEGRPDDPTAEWRFMLAQALFHSGRFDPAAEAAEHYLTLGAPEWRAHSARLLLSARERALSASGVRPRDEAPRPEGEPPAIRALEIPAPVQRLADARARFAEVMADVREEDARRRSFALENALVLYRYGHWEPAQVALRAVLEGGCTGAGAWDGAASAWRTLREMSTALGHFDAVQSLGQQIDARGCTFGQGAPSCGDGSDHPRCIARADRVAWRLRGGTQFLLRARQARAAERPELATRAGEAFLAALEVEGELDARGRATALVEAAGAFRMGGAAERAAEVDERIVRELDPRRFDEMDRPFAIGLVAAALFRQLEAAIAASNHERVVELSRQLLVPARDRPELASERARALSALPQALVALGRHADASRAFTALAAAPGDASVRREAELQAGLVLASGRGCGQAARPLRAFVSARSAEEGAHDAVVRALWQLAECQRRGTPQHVAMLGEVAQAGQVGLSAEARGRVAEAMFLLVDRDFENATRVRIRVPPGENIEDMTGNLQTELAAPTERVRELLAAYARVESHGIGRWSVAARQRSGAALEALDRAVLAASWELPLDLQRQRRLLNAATFAQIQRIVERRAPEILRAQAIPIRCRAAVHYRRAVEIAATADVDSEELRTARERLAALELPERCPTR